MDWTAISTVSTVVLVVITAYYAYITNRLLHEAAEANRLNDANAKRQLRVSAYPHLFCSMHSDDGRNNYLTITNAGPNPAFDVDTLLLTLYDPDQQPISDFVSKYVDQEHRAKASKIDDGKVDDYSVFRHFVHFVFPARRQVVIQLTEPIESDSYVLLLQFRDVYGTNYAHEFWFFISDVDSRRFLLGSVEPQKINPYSRISYQISTGDSHLLVDGKRRTPKFLKQLATHFQATISAGWISSIPREVEDPGVWGSLD